ncbi:hypothetical protein B0J17DRAFT_711152, partial [Rhizoctonia solani]
MYTPKSTIALAITLPVAFPTLILLLSPKDSFSLLPIPRGPSLSASRWIHLSHFPSPTPASESQILATRDGTALIGLEHLVDLFIDSPCHAANAKVEASCVDHPKPAPTPSQLHAEYESFSSLFGLYMHSSNSESASSLNIPVAVVHLSSPFSDEDCSPKSKLQLRAFTADVLSRQRRGEILRTGDLRLEDYEDVPADQSNAPSSYSEQGKHSQDVESKVSLGQPGSNSNPCPPRVYSPFPLPQVALRIDEEPLIADVDSTLVSFSVDDDGISASLSTSSSYRTNTPSDHDSSRGVGDTTSDWDMEHAFANLCEEIGTPVSSFDLARQLDSVELREGTLASSNSYTLDDHPLLTLPSIFIPLPTFHFDWRCSTLMTYHRRRADIHLDFSVHLVNLQGSRRLISHRVHSCKTYRTEAIGVLGQILSGSLKDAARVVGNCYSEARDGGAKFEVNVRIVTIATRHHLDSETKEWVSLGWQSLRIPASCRTRPFYSSVLTKFIRYFQLSY